MTGDTRFVGSGEHVMKKFIDVSDGEVVQGSHFLVIIDWARAQPEGIPGFGTEYADIL